MEFQKGERKKHNRMMRNPLVKGVTPPLQFHFPCMHAGRQVSSESLLQPVDWDNTKVGVAR